MGIDIVEIDRFRDADESFLKRVFTDKEIDYCKSKKKSSQHYAARFAGKEAVRKAWIDGSISPIDIEIINDINGVPEVNTPPHPTYSLIDIRVSLSHSDNYAVAIAWIG